MKKFYLILCLTALPILAFSQTKNADYEAYIAKWKNTALEQQKMYKIPAYITIAQGLLESGAGKSDLARVANNHFGIKCHNWQGKTFHKDDDIKDECFRRYEQASESFADHSLFLKKPRYAPLFELKQDDYKGWAKGLSKCGYATDVNYPTKLIKIIEDYGLLSLTSEEVIVVTDEQTDELKTIAVKKVMNNRKLPALKVYKERAVVKVDGRIYTLARSNDTYAFLAYLLNMKEKTLRKYNNAAPSDEPKYGDKIFLSKEKKKKYDEKKQDV